MRSFRLLAALSMALTVLGASLPALAAGSAVVATIKPVNSLVAGVMEGIGTPRLLVQAGASPHTYSLKPSDAEALQNADMVVWIGPELETFLTGPLKTLATKADIVELDKAPDLVKLPFREGGLFEGHHHHDEDAADADHEHDHEAGGYNPHIWLDPENARQMVKMIAAALEKTDPANAATYKANAAKLETRLDALVARIKPELVPLAGKPFFVFHDAYAYFENRFGLSASGTITVDPQTIPGAARLEEIHNKLKSLNAACVFAEPQFTPKVLQVVTEGTSSKTGQLDPLGATIKDGPDLYFALLNSLANSFKSCLG